jgi:tRNA 2-thiouridine synthesizing protein B
MKLLHLQRSSAFNTNDFQQCLSTIKPSDGLVLLDDGCYCLNHPLVLAFEKQHPAITIYYVNSHAYARAIEASGNNKKPIDMSKLVELTFEYDSTITWQ